MEIEDHLNYYREQIEEIRNQTSGLTWLLFRFGVYPFWKWGIQTVRKMAKGLEEIGRG